MLSCNVRNQHVQNHLPSILWRLIRQKTSHLHSAPTAAVLTQIPNGDVLNLDTRGVVVVPSGDEQTLTEHGFE